MKGVIVSVGDQDSLGNDRLAEPRALVALGNQALIRYSLEKLKEQGIQDILVLVNPCHRAYFDRVLSPLEGVNVREYRGPQSFFHTYAFALSSVGQNDHVLVVADDEVFDFSLDGLLQRFGEVDDNIVAVKHLKEVYDDQSQAKKANFGTCALNEEGRLVAASCSFFPETNFNSDLITLGIYLIHRRRVPEFLATATSSEPSLNIAQNWYRTFYAWFPPKEGFWADIGKPGLMERAKTYFSQRSLPHQELPNATLIPSIK